jgi:hypothetical protein
VRLHSQNLVALMLSLIVVISTAQTAGIVPRPVSADNTLSLLLTRSSTSTESASASATVMINLDSGQFRIDVRHASAKDIYQAMLITGTANAKLGNITTGEEGEGSIEGTFGAGTYAGMFQIQRLGAIQLVGSNVSFAIGQRLIYASTVGNASSSATIEYQTTSSQIRIPATTTATGQTLFRVDPTSKTISGGTFAQFNIQVIVNITADVVLAVNGVPPHGVAIFTQDHGVASPEFHSSLVILTSDDTPMGTYSITVILIVNGTRIQDANVSLEIVSPSVTTSTSTTISAGTSLVISVSTDQDQYKQNAAVSLRGQVTDGTGGAVNDASVALQVDGPNGAEIASAKLTTDTSGAFSFRIPVNATNKAGAYTIFASATKSGYTSATTHATFVAGASPKPSVVIKDIYTTDMLGNRSVIFAPGQTFLVWVAVANGGAAFDGVVWMQIRDSKDTPVWIQFQLSRLETSQTATVAFGFQATSDMRPGWYSANVLVSDMLISRGGMFLASAHSEFAIAL